MGIDLRVRMWFNGDAVPSPYKRCIANSAE